MEISDYIVCAIDDYEDGRQKKLESSLLHACIALDGTSSKLHSDKNTKDRFVETIEDYYWLIEPMLAIGINLEKTMFDWIDLDNPTFSRIIYKIFRCNLAHGDEIPLGFEVEYRRSDQWRTAILGQDKFIIPDTLTFALLSVSVFSKVNKEQEIGNTDYYLSHDDKKFVIDEYWGKENKVRDYFQSVDMPRVKFEF